MEDKTLVSIKSHTTEAGAAPGRFADMLRRMGEIIKTTKTFFFIGLENSQVAESGQLETNIMEVSVMSANAALESKDFIVCVVSALCGYARKRGLDGFLMEAVTAELRPALDVSKMKKKEEVTH